MRRKDALLPIEIKERQEWYKKMQEELFKNPPEPEITDDEEEEEQQQQERKEERKEYKEHKEEEKNLNTIRSKNSSKNKPSSPLTIHSNFQNFASMLAIETSTSKDLLSYSNSNITLQKQLKNYPLDILNKSLLRLNSPSIISSTLICLLGFGDNGLCLSKYSESLALQQIELISFQFPGKLERIHESCFESVNEYVEFILSCLTHHGYLKKFNDINSNNLYVSSTQSTTTTTTESTNLLTIDEPIPNSHPLALFGHNLGGIIAFEVAREIEKSTLVRLPHPPLQCLIVSGCRPPQALTQFNKDEKSRKFSKDSDKALLDRIIELGIVPNYMKTRRDIIGLYISRFRSDYLALESYKLLRSLGAKNETLLTCPITAICGTNDKSVSERLLLQWSEMTSGEFNSHIFDRCGHYYWLQDSNHEELFLRLLIQYTNPTHTLPDLNYNNINNNMNENNSEGYDDKSTVSSVSFQDSFVDSIYDRSNLNSPQDRRLKSSGSYR